jgi:hypothetical protein
MLPSDIEGKHICFLLDVEWGGKTYRFSTFPVDVNGVWYEGGLGDISINQRASYVNISIDEDTVAVDVNFLDVNWMAEWLQGRTLEQSQCYVSMVATKDNVATSEKYYVFNGVAKDPIFAIPEKPLGYIAFSIESMKQTIRLMNISFKIDAYQFPGLDQRAAALGRFIQYPMGKYVPFVFGTLGEWQKATVRLPSGNIGLEYIDKAKCTPVYAIDATGSGATLEVTYIISVSKVAATRIRIYDQSGGNFVNTVRLARNEDGVLYSYTTYKLGSVIEDNSFIPALDEDQTFWASWSEYGDSGLDPLTKESLGYAGNLCLYLLSALGATYNQGAWLGIKNVLNRYKFAGFVNDGEILTLDWLLENIIKYLPITVVPGEKGLEPKLNMYYYNRDMIAPQFHIQESGMFKQLTSMQPLDLEIINKIIVNYCFEGQNDHFLSTFEIDPTLPNNAAAHPMRQKDPISMLSYTRYGVQETEIDLPFVWDYDTVQRIAKDYIRLRALGAYAVEIKADVQYAYVQVGDVLSYTNADIGLINYKCQVVGKSWQNNSWHFILQLENNTFVNPRTV